MTLCPRLRALALAAAGATVLAGAAAQSVGFGGSIGQSKAVLTIDGQPVTLAVGQSVHGVTLKRLADGEAEVEVGGRVERLRLGATPARAGSAAPAAAHQIVIPAGAGGHFVTSGAINGKPVQFMVDTGATTVALSQVEATRIGLDWRRGRPGLSRTAGGTVPVHAVNLTSVRVGEVEVANVDAVVVPAEMPMVLLGNSFLARFSMVREADVMRLERKP